MTVVRRIARPMLAAVFVTGGLDTLLHPGQRAKTAAPLVTRMAGTLNLPDDPEMLVRANGATMLAAGSMLALGKFPRVAAIALAGAPERPATATRRGSFRVIRQAKKPSGFGSWFHRTFLTCW